VLDASSCRAVRLTEFGAELGFFPLVPTLVDLLWANIVSRTGRKTGIRAIIGDEEESSRTLDMDKSSTIWRRRSVQTRSCRAKTHFFAHDHGLPVDSHSLVVEEKGPDVDMVIGKENGRRKEIERKPAHIKIW
jgi:hypothetical protein